LELKLDACGLGLAGAHALASHLVSPSTSLRRLTVASNALGSDGFALLHAAATAAGAGGALVHLDCQFNGISSFAAPLGSSLWAQIAGSGLSCSFPGGSGGLGGLSAGLRELVLTCNALNDEGAASVAAALPFLPHLKELQLGFNLLGVKGVYPLVRALPHSHVECLDLSGNPLDAPSAWALAFALGHNSTLRKLGLDGTSLAGQAAPAGHLAVALLANPRSSLTHLAGVQLEAALHGFGVRLPAHGRGQSFSNADVLAWVRALRQAAAAHAKAIQAADHSRLSGAAGGGHWGGSGGGHVHNAALPYGAQLHLLPARARRDAPRASSVSSYVRSRRRRRRRRRT
jgi:hypothetical protein